MSHDLVVFVKRHCKSVHVDFFSPWVSPQSELPLLLFLFLLLACCFDLVLCYHLPLNTDALGKVWSHGSARVRVSAALSYFPFFAFPGQAS